MFYSLVFVTLLIFWNKIFKVINKNFLNRIFLQKTY